MDEHIKEEPPTVATKKIWLRNDSRMILQIKNSIDLEIVKLVNHCKSIKKLLKYLDFLYFGEKNISRVFDAYKTINSIKEKSLSRVTLWRSKVHV